MAFSIPEYNDRIIANPESRPQQNLSLPKPLTDTSFIKNIGDTFSDFKKEEMNILVDMKKERDTGIVNEFMNNYNTDRVAKITELKEKYKGGNSQGIIDEYKKWQDDYYTKHIGFSSDNEDGSLYLENDEQVKSAKEQLARSLPSEINTLSTYVASELEEYKKNQFTARVQFAADDLSDERDLNNIAMGIDNLSYMMKDFYKDQSPEFQKYMVGKMADEALSVNVANMIAVGDTDEKLDQAEEMLTSKVVNDNLTPKTRMDLEEKLFEKRAKVLGSSLASGSKKGYSNFGEALAHADPVSMEKYNKLDNRGKQLALNSFITETAKINGEYKKTNRDMLSLSLEIMQRVREGQNVSQEEVEQMSLASGLLPSEMQGIFEVIEDVRFAADFVDGMDGLEFIQNTADASEQDKKLFSVDRIKKSYKGTIPEEVKPKKFRLKNKMVASFYKKETDETDVLSEEDIVSLDKNVVKQAVAFENLSADQEVVNQIKNGDYDVVEMFKRIAEMSDQNPKHAGIALDYMIETEKARAFYIKNPDAEDSLKRIYKTFTSEKYDFEDAEDWDDFKQRVALKKISPAYANKTIQEVGYEVFDDRASLSTPKDCLMETLRKARRIDQSKSKDENEKLKTPAEFFEGQIRILLDGDEYKKYDLTDDTKDILAKMLARRQVAEAETFFRVITNE